MESGFADLWRRTRQFQRTQIRQILPDTQSLESLGTDSVEIAGEATQSLAGFCDSQRRIQEEPLRQGVTLVRQEK